MLPYTAKPSNVSATVTEVLPATGLAFLTGEDGSSWAITRATPGGGLDALSPGQRVALKIQHHHGFDIAAAYEALSD